MLWLLASLLVYVCADNCDLAPCSAPEIGKTCCCVTPCLEQNFTGVNNFAPGIWTVLSHFYFDHLFETNNRMFIFLIDNPQEQFFAIMNGVELCPATLAALKNLEIQYKKPILHIISPGDWHYLYLPQYLEAFPKATIHIPPGRIQREDPENSKKYTLIDMNNPLPFLKPTLQAIPFEGLQQGPADLWYWFEHRNEFVFFHPSSESLFAGDTLFYQKCGQPDGSVGVVTFNPQGMHMIANQSQAMATADYITRLGFRTFANIHGKLGDFAFTFAETLVKQAFTNLFNGAF